MIRFTLALIGCSGGPEPGSEGSVPPTASSLPDVVFVTMDTTRADRIGAYGHTLAETPAIDALARTGRRYERAYSPMPLTIPAHATMFTGQQPPTHGLRSNGSGRLPQSAETLAEHLSQNGYATAASISAFVTTRRWGFDQGFDVYFDTIEEQLNFWQSERIASEVVDDLLAWKEEADPAKPKFVWAHLYDPHFPYAAPSPFREKIKDRPYDAEIAYMDSQIARLVEAFSDRPTVFVLAGDHGEALGAHGEFTHGLYVYDATQRVPLIISGAGIDALVVEETVSLADVAPTLLDILGLPPMKRAEGRVAPGTEPVPIYMESYQLTQRFGFAPHVAVVHQGKKFIDVPQPELYGVGSVELKNLAEGADLTPWKSQLSRFGYTAPTKGELHLDPAVTAQLEALGYMEGSAVVDPSVPLADAKDHLPMLKRAQEVDRLMVLGKRDKAEQALAALATEYPNVTEFKNRRAKLLSETGRVEEALALVVEARQKDADDPVLKQSHATMLAMLGEYEHASVLFQEVARELPELPRARSAAFSALDATGDHVSALQLGDAYLKEYPNDGALAGVIGLALVRRGEIAMGLDLLTVGAAAPLPERDVCYHLASARLGQQDFQGALSMLTRELKFWPDNLPARFSYVRTFAGASKDREALLVAATSLKQRAPKSPEAHYWVAQALFNLTRDEEAADLVREGQALDAAHPKLMILQANLLARQGKKDEGAVLFERASVEAKRRAAQAGKRTMTP